MPLSGLRSSGGEEDSQRWTDGRLRNGMIMSSCGLCLMSHVVSLGTLGVESACLPEGVHQVRAIGYDGANGKNRY